MAEGKGFAHGGAGAGGAVSATNGSPPLDRVNGRRFSSPLVPYARQQLTTPDIEAMGHPSCLDHSPESCNNPRRAPFCKADSRHHYLGLLAGPRGKRPCSGSARSPRSSIARRRRDPTRPSFARSSSGAWASPRFRGHMGSRPRRHHRQKGANSKAEPKLDRRAPLEGLPRVFGWAILDPRTCTSV